MCVTGNPSKYTGLVHAAFPEHAVAVGGSVGARGGGDALPTRSVQVQHNESHALIPVSPSSPVG